MKTRTAILTSLILLLLLLVILYYRAPLNVRDRGNKLPIIRKRHQQFQSSQSNPQDHERDARLQRYQDVCATMKAGRTPPKVLYYMNPGTNQSLSLCPVPKAAITFWARVLQFLNRTEKSRPLSSPYAISRFDVYYRPVYRLQHSWYDDERMVDALRVMFTRNPYARLMSAYLDKFLLPQFMIWGSYGQKIAQLRGLSVKDENLCVGDLVTFKEFVNKFVLAGNHNNHWLPVHVVCDPCKLQPHVIGKQETFSKDAKHVLDRVGLGYLISNFSHKSYIGDEIKQMVDFTFAFRDRSQYLSNCFPDLKITERLWLAFQHNAYIPSNRQFAKNIFEKEIANKKEGTRAKDVITDIFVRENARTRMSRDQHKKQKRDMLVREYMSLGKATMLKLAHFYDYDFKLFGYEKFPKDLFP